MTKSALPKPIIIDLPYQSIDDKTEIEKAFVEQLGYETLSAVERETLHYIFDYPTVYVFIQRRGISILYVPNIRCMWERRIIFVVEQCSI